jgi:hypothetical protein
LTALTKLADEDGQEKEEGKEKDDDSDKVRIDWGIQSAGSSIWLLCEQVADRSQVWPNGNWISHYGQHITGCLMS